MSSYFTFFIFAAFAMLFLGILSILLPAKFTNIYYGVKTKWTTLNPDSWKDGQKLFAFSYFCIGLIYFILGILKVTVEDIGFFSVLIIIIVHKLSIFLVDKILARKYGLKV